MFCSVGAIKFGDKLTARECEELIKQLSECKLPYQCAHGRPTLVPLIDISNISCKVYFLVSILL